MSAPRLRRSSLSPLLSTGLWLLAGAGLSVSPATQAQGVPPPSSLPTSPGIGDAPAPTPTPAHVRLAAARGRTRTPAQASVPAPALPAPARNAPKSDDDLPPLDGVTPPAAGPGPGPGPAPAARVTTRLLRPYTPPLPLTVLPTPVTNPDLRSTPIVEPLSPATMRALAQAAQEREAAHPGARPTRLTRLAKGAPMRGGRLAPCLNSEFFTVPTDLKGMLATDAGRYGYGIGYEFVASIADLRKQHFVTDEALKAGINDALRGRYPLVSAQERLKLSEQLSDKFRATNREGVANAMMMLAAKNQAAAEAYLATNGQKPGVATTASGLQYEVLATGSGPKPLATDSVTVNYRGTLADGTEFDSSYARGTPASFPLNRVIPGWTEGVQLMNVGARYRFFVPPNLGYGPRGAGGKIGPNALLIFEVELLKIN